MEKGPDVLVVIVNYRSAKLTARAVESLAAERARHPELKLEAVVVENASGDEAALTDLLGGRHPDWLKLYMSPNNGGFGAGNNHGMRLSYEGGRPARFFHFLNPDTEVRPDGIAELVRFMESHPRAGIAGSRLENDDGSDWASLFRFPTVWSELEEGFNLGVVTKLLKKHVVHRSAGDEAAMSDWLPGASMMVRREMVDQIGGFDEAYFLYFEETDLALRARRAGWETWYVPQSRVMHIAGQSTGVTTRTGRPKPLPKYWFESRRRFFSKNHGVKYGALADLAFVASNAVGNVKRTIKNRDGMRPRLLRDFVGEGVRHYLNGAPVAPEREPLRNKR